ncbi:MAG: type II toxin-antitoxin system HipA family toxin [Pseudomonadota bacterium]
MERELSVYVDLNGAPVQVGRLWARAKQGKQNASFQYVPEWLASSERFALGPSLPLAPGQFHAIDRELFNCFTDAAPDRWGKMLMRHHERNRAKEAGTSPREMLEVDFLAGVDDQTRMGALRFKNAKGGEFLTQTGAVVPPVIELKNLLSATDRIEKGKPRKTDIALVLAPGASLGGARPKATVRDRDARLWLAKFPWANDDWPVIQWEWALLLMAEKAGVAVPKFRVEPIGAKTVLMIARFDRRADQSRLPYMSAFTALDAKDHQEDRSYLELVDALRQLGDTPREDLNQLWRRMVFNLLVSNVDDHVRNHGFLRGGDGWRLSPAFDMNPSPADVKGRIHVMAFNEDEHSSSLDVCMSVADYFALKKGEAAAIAAEVATVVATWRDVAKQCKLSKFDVERMESAFEHDDLRDALANAKTAPVKSITKSKATSPTPPAKTPAKKHAPAKKKTAATAKKKTSR